MVETVTLSGDALVGIRPEIHPRQFMATLPRTVRLGRIRPKARKQALRLACYLQAGYKVPPLPIDYATKAAESICHMYLNDTYGDCVIASAYHQVGLWTANESGRAIVGTDSEVLAMYHKICGAGDHGCDITAVLDYTRDHGLPFNGELHKIDGYVAIDWTNLDEVLVALYLFGSIKLGINLPSAWTNSATWDVTTSHIVGGHDVPCVGADESGIEIASWARLYKITNAAFKSTKWLEEAYCILSGDWYAKLNTSPVGIDAAALKADLAKLAGGVIPDITPPSPIPPGPGPSPGPNPIPSPGTFDVIVTVDPVRKTIRTRF